MAVNQQTIELKPAKRRPWRLMLLMLILGGGFFFYQNLTPVSQIRQASTETSISAEEIKRIIELNGASVKVHVKTDSIFTEIKTKELLGFQLKFLEKEEVNRLVEKRTWLIKAGVIGFDIEKGDTTILKLRPPEITSKEHLVERYTVVKRVGVWNPVTMKKIELQSRDQAVQTAINNGLLTEAKYSIENALYAVLPENVKLIWTAR